VIFSVGWILVSIRIRKKWENKMEKILIMLIQDVLEKRLIYIEYILIYIDYLMYLLL